MKARNWAPILAFSCSACGFEGYALTLPENQATNATAGASNSVGGAGAPATSQLSVSGIFAGQTSACAVVESGAVYCWGSNAQGELGSGDLLNRFAPAPVSTPHHFDLVSLGSHHACAIHHPTHAIYCWGLDANGQLGLADAAPRLVPTLVPLPQPAKFLASGHDHSCAILNDGTLWCWGLNCEGQVGLADVPPSPNQASQCVGGQSPPLHVLNPTQIGLDTDWFAIAGGEGHSCGLRGSGELWCWGRNVNGTLGLGTTDPTQLRAPQRVGLATDWAEIDLGETEGYGLRKDGSMYRWGDDNNVVNLLPVKVGTDLDWSHASTDSFGSCALKRDGRMFCWGSNGQGQLGLGDTADRVALTQTGLGSTWLSVSVGRFFACGMKTDHSAWCTGSNANGELGVGDTMDRSSFTQVAF